LNGIIFSIFVKLKIFAMNDVKQIIGKYRWTICSLVFFATTVNYLDRNVLGLLKETLTDVGVFGETIGEQERNYSYVIMSFQIAYALGMLGIGRLIDKLGTKMGYFFALLGWSIAAIGHALARGSFSFGAWRAALGISEAGNFPAANKTIAIWFPKKERAYATGIYNSGAGIGAILAPLTVPFIARAWGWEWAFILTGLVGMIWLIFWFIIYQNPDEKLASGKLSQEEYDYIHSDKDEAEAEAAAQKTEKVSWFRLLGYRQTWAFFFGKFLTDPIWWFYLFWLPAFLQGENVRKVIDVLNINLKNGALTQEAFNIRMEALDVGRNNSTEALWAEFSNYDGYISWPFAVAVVYVVSILGSVLGGWLPKKFINSGMDANRARKTSMFLFALVPLSVLLASYLGNINTWFAVGVISIACAAHQAWSANIFTTVSDMFPKKAVASVTGIGGMAGAVGGMLIAFGAGELLAYFGELGKRETGYAILFIICALAYMAAWLIMHFLVPKYKKISNL
jgi:ACS family hexuronate transporter-like MFS transporter